MGARGGIIIHILGEWGWYMSCPRRGGGGHKSRLGGSLNPYIWGGGGE